jgi:beta-glucosidase-like glycosyl hydrolase
MFMVPEDWKALYENTLQQVRSGEISRERLQEAVRRILRVKMRAGLFTDPKPSQRPHGGGDARQRLASWHDPAPGGFTYVTEQGITTIEPGQPAPQPSPSYKRFTDVWREARRLIYDVLPASDDPLDPRVFDVGREPKTK